MLSKDTHDILYALFLPIKSLGRVLIPVGVHTLKCTNVTWEHTKNGKSMLVIELWKKPMVIGNEKVSFGKMFLRHVVGEGDGGNWYDNFTVGLPYDFLIKLERKLVKRPEFQAVIGRRQTSFGRGNAIYDTFWENYISCVYRLEDNVQLGNNDYLNLIHGDINTLVGGNKPLFGFHTAPKSSVTDSVYEGDAPF